MEWKFNDTMSFLVPHLQPKRSGINISRLVNSVWHHWLLRTSFYLRFLFYSYIYMCVFCRTRRTWGSITAREETSVPALSMCGSEEQASCSSEMQRLPSSSLVPSPSAGERDRPWRCRSPRERASPGSPMERVSPSRTTSETRRKAATSDVEERRESPPKLESELDECYHFALSLVPLLRRLDHSNRQHAKIGILNLLTNLDSSTFK